MAILNHRDYRVAKARLAQLEKAIGPSGAVGALIERLPPEAATARRTTLEAEFKRLTSQVRGYERLRADGLKVGDEVEAGDLGTVAILARISQQLSQKDLAEKLGMKEQQIQRYEREKYQSISLDRFGRILSALGVELQPRLAAERDAPEKYPTLDVELTPELLRDLRKRNWVELPRGSAQSVMRANLARYIERQSEGRAAKALNRQTRSRNPSTELVNLWVARVLELAKESRPRMKGKFNITDTGWLTQLVGLSAFPDGPLRAVNLLRDHGIIFVTEPHLPTTMLDGAAMMTPDGIPVVAVTLRHDRIDNFWFTLLHELGHVYLHFGTGLSDGFIDDDLSQQIVSDAEREADDFARTRLISDDLWKASPVRFTKSRDAVEKFARRLNIHPAIVAGRIRNERDYSLFADVVGSGQVRKLFAAYPS